METQLKFDLPPDWETIQDTWDICLRHLTARGLHPDAAYALCMVSQELLENAVKYGSFEPGRERIRYRLEHEDHAVCIEVRTPLSEDPARLRRLDGMIQWIRGFQNPFEAYVERLKEVAAQPYAQKESGLGLVRAAYEGQCLLDFFVDDTNVLAMSAVYQAPRPALELNDDGPRDVHPKRAEH